MEHLIKLHIVKADNTTKLYWQTEILEAFYQITEATTNLKPKGSGLPFKEYFKTYYGETTERVIKNYIKGNIREWNKNSDTPPQLINYSLKDMSKSLATIYKEVFTKIATKNTWDDEFLLDSGEYQLFSGLCNTD